MSLELRSPKNDRAAIRIPSEVANLQKSFNGTVCSNKGDEYHINNNIIDFLGDENADLSWAQSSNQWRVTAALYEDIWRKRSLSIFIGEEFPIHKEQELLKRWLKPCPEQLYLDVGCSTALYGRLLKKSEPNCSVVSLDLSRQMLLEARLKAEAEQTEMYLLRADGRQMPFFADTFDGLCMGGTLNELTDPLKVLFECRRVIKEKGTFFIMHLLKSDTWYLRLLQDSTEFSGLKFWTVKESNQLFERSGFKVEEQFTKSIVCFTKLIA